MKKLGILFATVIMLMLFTLSASANDNTFKVGDIIQFGSYPQSEVKDVTLISELNIRAPLWDNWMSYGYCTGTGGYGTMVQGNWMRYTDITYNGDRYRGVKFTQYRPYTIYYNSSNIDSYQDDNGYYVDNVYWFKFEPICWKIINPINGLVISETIIDSQPYTNTIYQKTGINNPSYAYFNDSSYTNYASDYETSYIREWLNGDFYNTAFSLREKDEIKTTTLNNISYWGVYQDSPLDSNSTNDKIFLFSFEQVSDFDDSELNITRNVECSNYAKIQGVFNYKNSVFDPSPSWLLRTPGVCSNDCCYVGSAGPDFGLSVAYTAMGIRPAFKFKDINNFTHEHVFNEYDRIDATCITEGEVVYKCKNCNEMYEVVLPKQEHNFVVYLETKIASCTEEGEMAYFCDFCELKDETSVVKTEKLPHSFKNDWQIINSPTCENNGTSIRICSNCTFVESKTLDKLLHSYTSTITKEPSCVESGSKTYTCTCGDTYTETIPATNHPNATTDPGKAPTATDVGYTEGKYCPDCKIWIEGHTEIHKLEEHKHSYAPTTTQEATCWREGVKTYTCSCGDTYTETIAKLEHQYRPWETTKNPTCTKPGLEWSYCLICDNDFEREIPAEGHNEYAYTRRATPAEAGAYVVACDKCWIEFSSVSFGRPAEYKLLTTTYTYNGKAKTPKLTITTSDGKVLKKGVDYTVELPKDRTSVGTHTYRVVFMGDYLGETKVSYQILPGKTSSVSASQSTDYIKLSWKKVSGATGYRVYQYNSSTGKYKTLKTLTGTSYTVKNLKAGTTYKFAVKAYTKADGETLWAASSKTLTTATKPATPTVKATAGSGKATLSWNKISGATGYVVYMMDEFGDYVKVGSTKKTSYTVTDLDYGKTYNFRVKAYKTAGDKNVYSGHKTVKVTTLYPAVYVTPSGKRYHYDKECAGKNATKTTLANAKKTKTPCKTCVL